MTSRDLSWLLPLVLLAGACEPAEEAVDPTNPEPTDPTEPTEPDPVELPEGVVELTVDATDAEGFAYVDLHTGQVVEETDAWELAISRSVIVTNGGTSGDGTVTVGLANAQDEFYDADGAPLTDVFLAATPEGEVEHLVADFEMPPLTPDEIAGVFQSDWFVYDYASGTASEDDTVGWILRGGEGDSFARVRVTEFDFPTRAGQGIVAFTVEVELEETDGFAEPLLFQGSVPAEGGRVCFDMDVDENVACEGTAWDLALGFEGRNTFLYTNSGDVGEGEGGALGPYDWTDLSTWTSASTDPSGDDLRPFFERDISESVFGIESWYAYNLQGRHTLYPNYRVYVVDPGTEEPAHAVQVTSFYDPETSTSGFVTLRFRELAGGN